MVAALIVGIAGAAVGVGDREIWMARRNEQIELLETEGMLGILRQRIDPKKATMFSPGFVEKNRQVVEKYSEVFKESSAEGYRKVLESMGQRGRPIDFSAITCPTLIIVGDADAWSGPEAGRVLQERITDRNWSFYRPDMRVVGTPGFVQRDRAFISVPAASRFRSSISRPRAYVVRGAGMDVRFPVTES
jgi:hypothetical protein